MSWGYGDEYVRNLKKQLCYEGKLPSNFLLVDVYDKLTRSTFADGNRAVDVSHVHTTSNEDHQRWEKENKYVPQSHSFEFIQPLLNEAVGKALPPGNDTLLHQYGYFDCPLSEQQREELNDDFFNKDEAYQTSVFHVYELPDGFLDNVGTTYFKGSELRWINFLMQIAKALRDIEETKAVEDLGASLDFQNIAYFDTVPYKTFKIKIPGRQSSKMGLFPITTRAKDFKLEHSLDWHIAKVGQTPLRDFFKDILFEQEIFGGLPLSIERFLVWCVASDIEIDEFWNATKALEQQLLSGMDDPVNGVLRHLAQKAVENFERGHSDYDISVYGNHKYLMVPRTTSELRRQQSIGGGTYGKIYPREDNPHRVGKVIYYNPSTEVPQKAARATSFSEDFSTLSPQDFYSTLPRKVVDKKHQSWWVRPEESKETFSYELVGDMAIGDLGSVMKRLIGETFSTKLTLAEKWFCQLIHALDTLHNHFGFAHLDIKPGNFLVFEGLDAKLADYDLMHKLGASKHDSSESLITPNYRAFWLNDDKFAKSKDWPFTGAEDRFSMGLVLGKVFLWLFCSVGTVIPRFNWDNIDGKMDALLMPSPQNSEFKDCPGKEWKACSRWLQYIWTIRDSNPHSELVKLVDACIDELDNEHKYSWLWMFLLDKNKGCLKNMFRKLNGKLVDKDRILTLYTCVKRLLDLENIHRNDLKIDNYMKMMLPQLSCPKHWQVNESFTPKQMAMWDFISRIRYAKTEKEAKLDPSLEELRIPVERVIRKKFSDKEDWYKKAAEFVLDLATRYQVIHPESTAHEAVIVSLSWAYGISLPISPLYLKYYFPLETGPIR